MITGYFVAPEEYEVFQRYKQNRRSFAIADQQRQRKDRPRVIVLATEREDNDTRVTVLPITHSPPTIAGSAVEIPPPIKEHLGLDEAPSWVVVCERNEFQWPGYDLRKVGREDRYNYGFLPPRSFKLIIEAFASLHWTHSGQLASRDQSNQKRREYNRHQSVAGPATDRHLGPIQE